MFKTRCVNSMSFIETTKTTDIKRDVIIDRLKETAGGKTVANENFLFSAGQQSNENAHYYTLFIL